ncbi:selenoprotein family protein [Klebsormidium nitens]|uniref:Selenoprotein F n=1 Tax=Klebsormidium nitens TaxID=105231 RepID=A0A0U9HJX2_KLENI|nr:selenoprotein family protein [Klebsormidium nitens]|eukprot:GAQ81836.1 selenoprotein family protein [Klebsormidium nitens]
MATRTGMAAILSCILLFIIYKQPCFAENLDSANDAKAELSCEELGFTGLGLRRFCDTFAEYVKDAELEADCRRCSIPDDGDDGSKVVYASATLEVCNRKVRYYSAVSTFLEKHMKDHPKLTLKHRSGSAPKLVMKDEDGEVQETIRIDKWKTEHINEFLKQKLQSPDSNRPV